MKRKYVPVRLPDEIFARIRKIAAEQGWSVSETVGTLVQKEK
jgi:hypothetical protein